MDEKNAKQTIAVVDYVNAILNLQLLELQKNLSPEAFDNVRRGFGIAIGELFVEAIDPLYKAYPNLAPEEFGGTAPKTPDAQYIDVFNLIKQFSHQRP